MRSAFRFSQFPFRFYAIGLAAFILSQLLLT